LLLVAALAERVKMVMIVVEAAVVPVDLGHLLDHLVVVPVQKLHLLLQ
jgi:hypothetical protein